jgi:regulator of sigma E protease
MTNLPLTIIEFILVLGVMLFLHEFGHYLVCLLCKVDVEEFGLGFPPRMLKLFTWKGTDFTLNWLPFGAFVRPKGENDPEIPGGLGAANPWKRLAVLMAGPAMNILTGFLVFVILYMQLGAPNTSKVEVAEISANSPAASAGLKPGDMILKLNGQAVTGVEELQTTVKQYLDQKITLDIQRGSENISVSLTPRSNPPEGEGAIGFAITYPYEPITISQAIPEAVITTGAQIKSIVVTPVQLITGKLTGDQARFVGPVGIFDIYQTAKTRDDEAATSPTGLPAVNVLLFIATISLALGITNLLPIPALDGGRILFIIPELILKKRVPAEFENYVHMIGFAALLLLMVYITMQDIINPIAIK